MSTFAEYTKKKKKKDVDASELAKKHSSFRDYTEEVLGVELAPLRSPVKTTVDIAPVKPTVNESSSKPADKITNLMSVYGNKDFSSKSGYVSTKSEGIWEKLGSKYGMNYNDLQYEYINNQNDIRKEIDSKAMSWGSDLGKTSSSYKEKALDYMTEDEVAVYNYYYQTEGKDKAQEFLDALAETLNARKAGKDFESIEGKTAREILYGTVAGAEQFKQGVKGFGSMITSKDDYIPQTSTQILTGKIREDLADDGIKVFGNSLGQVVHDALSTGTNMLPSVMTGGVAGAILMGATAAGNAYQQDLNEFGDKEKARIYATTIGALEGTLQHFMGGIGQLGGTSAAISNAVSGVKNGALRFALEYGGKIGSEALEEGLQEVLDPVVKNWTHGTDESVDWENVAYSALLGGLMGGVFGATEVSSTHLNANENAVVDKVYNDTIAEREADGKKLSQKEKSKIYEETLTKLEKGYIDIDTIESVIGGDTYNAYKAEVDKEAMQEADYKRQEEALNKQLEELKNSANTLGNAQKYQEVENKLAELKKTTENSTNEVKSQLKSQLESEMLKTVQGTKLAESYNERTRRGQNLEVDVESYTNESAKQTAQNFRDFRDSNGKGLNNTNATHDYLDLVTKVAEDRGHSFKFMTTKQLEESIANGNPYNIDADPNKVEAFVSGNTKEIIINMDANKSLTSLVGHEITHSFEKANGYSDLESHLIKLAEIRGEYDSRWESVQRRYKNLSEAEQKQELVSDLVGDYVFGDSDFISNLSTENPNIFKKIYNEIKYLWKMATAGSKEYRELERVKREFEKIWAEGNSTSIDADVKLSVAEIKGENGDYGKGVVLDTNIFEGIPTRKWNETVKNYVYNELVGTTLTVYNNGVAEEIYLAKKNDRVTKDGSNNSRKVIDKLARYKGNSNVRNLSIVHIDELAETSTYESGSSDHTHQWLDENGWEHRTAYVMDRNGKIYSINLDIAKGREKNILYDINNIKEIDHGDVVSVVQNSTKGLAHKNQSQKYSIAENPENSSKSDSNGRKLTAEQQVFFVDSKIRDENKNLKVMYHGSPAQFTVFDKKKAKSSGYYGRGFYFSESESHAGQYGSRYEVYLNIKNPVQEGTNNITKEQLRRFVDELAENEDYGIENYGYGATVDSVTDDVYGKDDFAMLMDLNASCVGDMATAIQLFNEVNGTDYDGIVAPTETVAFYPNQIKSVDNTNPTSDADIRFSLSDTVEETKDLIAVHNLRGQELLKTLELGGLPMPSVAIIKAQDGHEMYGDVTLILPKDTIDPKADKANKVYGGDAWTPTYPKIEYKPNAKVEKRISDKYYEFANKYGYDEARPLYNYVHEMEDALNRSGGESALLEKLYKDTELMQMFLQDTGKEKVQPIVNETETKISDAEAEMNQYLIDTLGSELVSRFKVPAGENPMKYRKAYMEEHETEIRSAYAKLCEEVYGFTTEDVENVLNNTDTRLLMKIMRGAYMYTQNNGVTVKTETDYEATKEAIRNAAKDGYKEWVDDLFKGVEEKTGIRNNADVFTRSGNRRSWDALHWENTLENVVKVMKQQDNGQAFFGGVGIWGVSAKEYGSIGEIKSDSDRLRKMSDEEYEKVKESYQNRLSEIAGRIMSKTERNQFIAIDDAMSAIVDSVRVSKTQKGIFKELKQYGQLNATEKDAADIVSLVKDIANMPTGYFEAKPQRAVGLDEVGVFVIPYNTDAKLKQELLSKGYSIAEYNPEVEGDRKRVVNQFEEYKFRIADDTYKSKEYGRHIYSKDVLLAPTSESLTMGEESLPIRSDYAPLTEEDAPVAQILTEEPTPEKKKSRFWEQAAELVADKGFVFENLSKKTKNRELEAKWNFIRYADSKAQDFIGNGADGVKSLDSIQKEVNQAGITKELYEYLYHLHNIDRMSLTERYGDVENKPVFGDSVTADVSRSTVAELDARHPELKRYANEIYSVNNYLRNLLVEGGVLSQKTADLWTKMYPHYVPIRRAGERGLKIDEIAIDSNPLDSKKTGVNAPIKRATGGSSDILPLFDTMAQRALQTYKAVAKNRFGVELKNTLGTTIETEAADVDSVIEGVDHNEELLQKGKNGRKPTFTVFEGGEKVTFEITDTMYDALKPTSEALTYTNKIANTISNAHRGVLTEYNPSFLARNFIKDTQDVLFNSQHPAKTYANFPKAMKEMTTKGKWYTEYVKNGGEQNTYFDKKTNTYSKEEKSKFIKAVGMPLNAISTANNFIEKLPRLAEYIASREAGRSIEVSMLDSARVTTNFSAGGDLTKFLNRNGATFLNASVQGVMQNVRNVREAKMNGLKGWAQLAGKCAVAIIPAIILNNLMWDDDDEYEELSDYVKQNYYVVAKFGDGKFVRIPKGRTLAVIQDALEQTMNALSGNDEADLASFTQLVITNLAPNNPIEDNILAPVIQAWNNETWYGDDLVPTRLQDLPSEEQYDESTDSLSVWLGERVPISPYKINYLLNQYSGAVGDSLLPMITPEAESEKDTAIGKMTAPIRDAFTTDSVLKNQNVSDFYTKKDELVTNAKRRGATDEDILSNKYFNSVSTEIGKLYGEKREIQSGDYTDSEKYYLVKEIQKKINALSKEALNEYDNVTIDGSYATVGGKHYKLTDDGWEKITDEQVKKMKEVTRGLGISEGKYWSNKQEYDMKYKYPEKYKVLQEQGISVKEYKEKYEETAFIYTDDYSWASDNPEKYAISKVITDDVRVYKQYTSELNAIKGDGAKERKKAYIFGLDNLDYGQQAILYRSIFDAKKDKEAYNYDIVEYLNSRDDITYEEYVDILEALEMQLHSDGRVTW